MRANYTEGPWSAVANSWQHMTIYSANQTPICRLNLEDWGVDEDNEDELQREQKAVAQRIVKCANSHDELLALCVRGEKWLTEVEASEIARGHRREESQYLADLRAAIAKAPGASHG